MPTQSQSFASHTRLLEHAVFGLDRWLRQRQGVCEYTDNPHCLLRIQLATAERDLVLGDGTRVDQGAALLNLHLWNEHVPPMSARGPTLSWARTLARGVDLSLRELALHLRWTREFDAVVALRADMRLGTAGQTHQLVRIVRRYGFEATYGAAEAHGAVHRLAENLFIVLLVLATNPAAFGTPVLRRDHTLVYLSRLALEQRYAVTDGRRGNRGATLC